MTEDEDETYINVEEPSSNNNFDERDDYVADQNDELNEGDEDE